MGLPNALQPTATADNFVDCGQDLPRPPTPTLEYEPPPLLARVAIPATDGRVKRFKINPSNPNYDDTEYSTRTYKLTLCRSYKDSTRWSSAACTTSHLEAPKDTDARWGCRVQPLAAPGEDDRPQDHV